MNYKESVAYIESLVPTLERPTLARMKQFMVDENNLQDQYKCFHVGGTNGKGSTATILESILVSTGLKVGKFTGPHIMRFNERFSINGKTIKDEEFADIATNVRQRSEAFASRHEDLGRLTWFEFLTAMAFFFFEKNKIDCAVLEVGLGGRFDATNVADNIAATIITNIDLDHMHILGDTVEKIAFEKAGIMRKGVPVITAASGPALEELKSQARKKGAILIQMPERKADVIPQSEASKVEQALECLSLSGPHQKENAELAIVALLASKYLHPSNKFLDSLAKTLLNVYFAGRMQFGNNKFLIMDGAHNPAGAKALRRALDQLAQQSVENLPDDGNSQTLVQEGYRGKNQRKIAAPENRKGFCFILGFFGNKNVPDFLKELLRTGDRVIAVEADVRRSTFPKEEIASLCAGLGIDAVVAQSMPDALKLAQIADQVLVGASAGMALSSESTSSMSLDQMSPSAGFVDEGRSVKTACGFESDSRTSDNRAQSCEVVVTGSFAVLKELMLTLGWQTVDDGRVSDDTVVQRQNM